MILQQLPYSDTNLEQLDLLSYLFSLKNSFATKIHIQVQISFVDRAMRRRGIVFFGRITRFLDPHLGPWQNQKQRSKEFNFALKKKCFIQVNPTSAGWFVFQYLDTNWRRAQVRPGCSTRRWNPRTQPQTWTMANWNSRPQQQHQLPAQGLVKWNPRLQQQHLQSWYLEKQSLSPSKSLELKVKPQAPGAPVASLEPNRKKAGGPRKQFLPAWGWLELRTLYYFFKKVNSAVHDWLTLRRHKPKRQQGGEAG